MNTKKKLTSLLLSTVLPLTGLATTPPSAPPMPHTETWESSLGNHSAIDQQLDDSPTIKKAIEQGQHIEDLQYQKTLYQLENDIAALKAARQLMAAQTNAATFQAAFSKSSEMNNASTPVQPPSAIGESKQPKKIKPVLQGILIKDSLQLALIRMDDQQVTVQTGQKLGNYRVESIKDDEVILVNQAGETKTLKLDTTR